MLLGNPYPVLIGTSGLLGIVAGVILHRSDFCIAGMFRDFFLFRDDFGLRVLLLLVVATMALIEIVRFFGLLPETPFPLLGAPSAANLVGGMAFGIGMVLAGGCVVGTLYKMAVGSLASFLAFLGIIAGSFLYGEIHTWWSELVSATIFAPEKVTLSHLLGVPSAAVTFLILISAAGAMLRWRKRKPWQRAALVEGYVQPWKAALVLATITIVSLMVIGMPLGITTGYSKLGAIMGQTISPMHMASLPYFQSSHLIYTPPFSDTVLTGGAGPAFDAIAGIQFPLIAGVLAGAAGSALLLGEWRLHLRLPWRQAVSVILGGTIMGLSARMAPACNLWHLMGGLPVLALQSLLFLTGLIPGAWLGTCILKRWVLPAN